MFSNLFSFGVPHSALFIFIFTLFSFGVPHFTTFIFIFAQSSTSWATQLCSGFLLSALWCAPFGYIYFQWTQSSIQCQSWNPQTFNCDSFAFTTKNWLLAQPPQKKKLLFIGPLLTWNYLYLSLSFSLSLSLSPSLSLSLSLTHTHLFVLNYYLPHPDSLKKFIEADNISVCW